MSVMDPILLDRYTRFLTQVLTPHRLTHSFGVMQVMEELAEVYALDPEKAVIAGLLHDAGKDLPPEQWRLLIAESGLEIEGLDPINYSLYFHGPVGAYYVHKELGISDALILDAIHMHSFFAVGENFYSPFAWCLRFADVLEPNRSLSDSRWNEESRFFAEGRQRLREAVFAGKLTEAAWLQTDWFIKMFEEKGFPIHPNVRRTHQELTEYLNVNDSKFWR
jgi:predicted HD superfamily hydrolase involved in NAD metabolism